ncbi:MAG: nucleotidyltransferase family protein [Nocardioidaceae bacterium]
MTGVVGLLLAAGAGRRMGRPKALVESPDGTPWVVTASGVLRDGGCDEVVVVLGAEYDRVRALLEAPLTVVEAADWETGMGASLRAGLDEVAGRDGAGRDAESVLVHLVDLPDVGPDVVRRVASASAPDVLARATYRDGPGHPVLIGREHWAGVAATATGDRGARDYLRGRHVLAVDCSDLAGGADVDRPTL